MDLHCKANSKRKYHICIKRYLEKYNSERDKIIRQNKSSRRRNGKTAKKCSIILFIRFFFRCCWLVSLRIDILLVVFFFFFYGFLFIDVRLLGRNGVAALFRYYFVHSSFFFIIYSFIFFLQPSNFFLFSKSILPAPSILHIFSVRYVYFCYVCVCVCMCVFLCAFLWHFFPSRFGFGFVHIHLCSCTLSSPYRLTGAYICDISEISLCFMQWLYLYAVYDISYGKLFRWCCCRRRRWWLFSPYFFFFIFLLYFIVWLALWTSNDITLTIRQPYTI